MSDTCSDAGALCVMPALTATACYLLSCAVGSLSGRWLTARGPTLVPMPLTFLFYLSLSLLIISFFLFLNFLNRVPLKLNYKWKFFSTNQKKTKIADEIKGAVEELFVLPHHPKHKSGSRVLSEIILPLLSAFKISRFITPLSICPQGCLGLSSGSGLLFLWLWG